MLSPVWGLLGLWEVRGQNIALNLYGHQLAFEITHIHTDSVAVELRLIVYKKKRRVRAWLYGEGMTGLVGNILFPLFVI